MVRRRLVRAGVCARTGAVVTAADDALDRAERGLIAARDFLNALPLDDGASRRAKDREYVGVTLIPGGLVALATVRAELQRLRDERDAARETLALHESNETKRPTMGDTEDEQRRAIAYSPRARDLLELNGVLPNVRVVQRDGPGVDDKATALFLVVADYGWAERILYTGSYQQDAEAICAAIREALS